MEKRSSRQQQISSSIHALKVKVHVLWIKACEHDGISSDEAFVVFSDDNPHVPEMRKAQQELSQAIKQAAIRAAFTL